MENTVVSAVVFDLYGTLIEIPRERKRAEGGHTAILKKDFGHLPSFPTR